MKRQDLTDALRIITIVVLAFIAIYLIKISDEIKGIRQEQVKNLLYSNERLQGLDAAHRKRMESTVQVRGSVAVEGQVELQTPVEVEGTVSIER